MTVRRWESAENHPKQVSLAEFEAGHAVQTLQRQLRSDAGVHPRRLEALGHVVALHQIQCGRMGHRNVQEQRRTLGRLGPQGDEQALRQRRAVGKQRPDPFR